MTEDIDNLQLEYARASSLALYEKVVEQGAKKWSESAVLAGAHSLEIVDYLFRLFTHPKRSLILAGYATVRYLQLFEDKEVSLAEYLTDHYEEPEAKMIWNSIAIGAATADNVPLVEKCIKQGAGNISEIVQAAVASGALKVLAKYYRYVPISLALETAARYGNFASLQFLEQINGPRDRARLAEIAASNGHAELAAYLRG